MFNAAIRANIGGTLRPLLEGIPTDGNG